MCPKSEERSLDTPSYQASLTLVLCPLGHNRDEEQCVGILGASWSPVLITGNCKQTCHVTVAAAGNGSQVLRHSDSMRGELRGGGGVQRRGRGCCCGCLSQRGCGWVLPQSFTSLRKSQQDPKRLLSQCRWWCDQDQFSKAYLPSTYGQDS